MSKLESRPTWQLSEYDKPLITASYFGFTPIHTPKITPTDLKAVEHCTSHPHYDAGEKAALIRTYIEEDFASLPHPLALIYKRPAGRKKSHGYNLHYIGAQTGIAEASLARAALSILSDEGYKDLRIELNCVGDKDSLATYERELINFAKKFGGHLSEEIREHLKADIFNLFRHEAEEVIQLRSTAPSALSYLSASSRAHFKEVLEFIEALGVDFTIAPELVGDKHHSSHTIFAIKTGGAERELNPHTQDVLATGYRYSRLSKRLGMKKEIPMASVSIYLDDNTAEGRKVYKELPKPKFYLVQLGHEAKIRTLGLIESLRAERIPVHHFLGKDKLTAQLQNAEALRVPYLIIIGHKEALDHTATVRNMNTRAQDTIPMSILPQYLKHISL